MFSVKKIKFLISIKLHFKIYFIIFSVKPHIDRTNLEASTIRKGRSLKLDVNVRGEPAPKVTWYLKDQVNKF